LVSGSFLMKSDNINNSIKNMLKEWILFIFELKIEYICIVKTY
jgi:hypothetical protein